MTSEGELIELHQDTLNSIAMDIVNDKEQQEQKSEDIKRYYREREGLEKELKTEFGSFYFTFYNKLPKLPKQYLFRYIFMCTYLKYEDSRMMIKENGKHKPIFENDLQQLLKLSKREYYYTKKELINNNLIKIDEVKHIHINNNLCMCGNIGKGKNDYIRIFNSSIRDIYNKSLANEHKLLYTFIELLPYVNYNLNILCFNPAEVEPDLIEPLELKDISNILNAYKGNNRYKLQNILLNTFIKEEKALMIVKDYKKEFYIINPFLYYKGNNIDDFKYLRNLFKVQCNTNMLLHFKNIDNT